MRFIMIILLNLSMALSHAQNVNDKLFGGDFTYIEFVVSKPHQYPVVFAAMTRQDTIKINKSNLDTFITSIYSVCKNTTVTDNAYHKGFEIVFGKSEQIFNCCSLFISDFNENFNRLKKTVTIELQTGEKIIIRYFYITGIFLKLDENFYSETVSSIGLSTSKLKKTVIVPISIVGYYRKNHKLIYD